MPSGTLFISPLLSVTLEILLGLSVALLLNRTFRFNRIVTALVLIPWAVPTVVSARIWEWMYNADFGVLNYLLGLKINWLGSPAWALNAAVFMDVWKTTPFVVILLLAGLRTIPADLYQAARIDGANAWSIFWKITLPLLKPAILVALLFRTLDAFRVFDAVYVLDRRRSGEYDGDVVHLRLQSTVPDAPVRLRIYFVYRCFPVHGRDQSFVREGVGQGSRKMKRKPNPK